MMKFKFTIAIVGGISLFHSFKLYINKNLLTPCGCKVFRDNLRGSKGYGS